MATILEMPEIQARIRRWTVADYEKLADIPEFRHSELIRGIIVEKMSKSSLHFGLTKRLYDILMRSVREGLTVRQEGPLRLADSVPGPDVAVVRGSEPEFFLRHPTTAELVVEVAVSSVAPDRENAGLYAEAGVAEYWIMLGELGQVEVYRQPVEGVYRTRRIYARGETIEGVGVTGGAVAVDALFA